MTSKPKIDWSNHTISFLSALLGILIAFQLEDYREDRQEIEEMHKALSAIKGEIESNLKIYRTNVDQMGEWLTYWNLIKEVSDGGLLTIKKSQFTRLQKDYPSRYASWKLIEENDSTLIFKPQGEFVVDVIPATGISVSSWKAAINSGIVNRMDNAQVIKLTTFTNG